MKPFENYRFADFDGHEKWISEIKKLEKEIQAELGEEITLIAYQQDAEEAMERNPSDCRAGLDG